MKKIFFIFILIISNIWLAFAAPSIPQLWMPGDWRSNTTIFNKTWGYFLTIFIRYVAIIAVISLMLAWISYLLSGWEDEKVKKAKNWIIWSLVWVFLSISAWWLINIINVLRINN
jgi:hypothetical protein